MMDPAIISEPKRREERVILFEGMSTNGPVGATLKVDTDAIFEMDWDATIPSIRIHLLQKDGSFEEIVYHKPLLCWYSIRHTTIVWPDLEVLKKPTRAPLTTPLTAGDATGLL